MEVIIRFRSEMFFNVFDFKIYDIIRPRLDAFSPFKGPLLHVSSYLI